MTSERSVLLLLFFANGAAGVLAAGATAAGLPLWVALAASAVVGGCGGVMILARSWFDVAPDKPG